MEKRLEKHVKKVMQLHATNPPVAPLKNLQNADQQAAKDIRDTPLVPRGTVADFKQYRVSFKDVSHILYILWQSYAG